MRLTMSRVPYNTRKPFKTQVVCKYFKYIASSNNGHVIRCGIGPSDGTKVPFPSAEARLAFMKTHCFICDGGCPEYRPAEQLIQETSSESQPEKQRRISERMARILADERCSIQDGRTILCMTGELIEASPVRTTRWPERGES